MRLHVLTCSLTIAAALALPMAHPSADINDERQPRLEIVRAATARRVFREGQHMALFTEAELAYCELTLIAESIEHNSAERTVALSGAVQLRTPDYSLNTVKCFVDLATGHVLADSGLELVNTTEGVTLKADRGSFWADPRDYRVNFDKAAFSLKFHPQFSVEKGARELISSFEQGLFKDFTDDVYYNVKYMHK